MTKGRVLVVDDKPANLMLLQEDLESEDFVVATAQGGEAGLAEAVAFMPDVILLDIKMPGMDGIDTCRHIRTDTRIKHIPVLFLTASGDSDEILQQCLQAGGNDFLQKPYNPVTLVARVLGQIRLAKTEHALRRMERPS
jgi:CheY-like chemotaxis protein